MRHYIGKADFDAEDYKAIVRAYQTGKLSAANNVKRVDGTTEITTYNPRLLCQQISKVVDFGATSAGAVMFDHLRGLV
jgi:hypothetical protein